MKLLFRTDVSKAIGTGHMARCLTLAKEAQRRGALSCFVLRDLENHFSNIIASHGHLIRTLQTTHFVEKNSSSLAHSNWLPVSQKSDARETLKVFHEFKPDWIIVDHYALDNEWCELFKNESAKILVIDDLCDREFVCDLLLNQNLGACKSKYEDKVPNDCNLLLGPKFALLREEFKDWRAQSLHGRLNRRVREILLTMGGVDGNNFTTRVLSEILKSAHSLQCNFTVIVGHSYPNLESLNALIKSAKTEITVLSNVTNMASIMSRSDLCVGAAGTTSWERCCLGLPTITLAIADNQVEMLRALRKNAIVIASDLENIFSDFEYVFGQNQKLELNRLSLDSASVCDGLGASRVLNKMEGFHAADVV